MRPKKDTRGNGRSIALIQSDLELSSCTVAAQGRVAKRTLGSASDGATSSLKTDAVLYSSALFAFARL